MNKELKNKTKDTLDEQYLVEVSRQQLLNLGKNSAKYKGKNTSRWTAKAKCSVANTVRDYNQIDMNKFWKDDILKFIVKVKGETDNYEVTVEFSKLSQKIQDDAKGKVRFKQTNVDEQELEQKLNEANNLIKQLKKITEQHHTFKEKEIIKRTPKKIDTHIVEQTIQKNIPIKNLRSTLITMKENNTISNNNNGPIQIDLINWKKVII